MYFLYPIKITSNNDTFRFLIDGNPYTVSLDEGTYYAYKGEISSRWPSLYDHIESKIQTETGSPYTFAINTPSQSPNFTKSGISITGAGDHGFDTDVGDFDYRIFGFNNNSGQKTSGGGDVLTGDFSRWGVWQRPSPMGFGQAWIDFYAKKVQYRNGAERVDNIVVKRWVNQEYRLTRFKTVPEAHVYPFKGDDSDFASAAKLGTGDNGNYWHDLWEEGISTYKEILFVHVDPTSLNLDQAGEPWEVLWSPNGSEYADQSDSSINEDGSGVRAYDLELGMQRLLASDGDLSSMSDYKRGR